MSEAKSNPLFQVPARVLAVVVIVAAVFTGGATQRVPQAIVLAAIGALIVAAPPQAWPERRWSLAAVGLLAVAVSGALPTAWFRASPWREAVQDAGIALPSTLSPQPQLTLESWLLLAAGIAWTAWLLASPWDSASRRLAARTLALGFGVLAVFSLVQWRTGWRPPGWLSDVGRGPFPNRNHTAHVLALGGVLAVGCSADAMRRGVLRGLPWLLVSAVILAALAVTYSRGGVLMFFCALGLWNAAVAWTRRSWKILLLGLSAICVAVSAVLVFGGPIAARFAGGADSGEGFRFKIWKDTAALISASPWCGVGLGNFRALFPFFRNESVIQSTVLHPESDWLQLAAECGWLAVALALTAFAVAVSGTFPLERGTQRRLRGAAVAAAVAAVMHGFVDVPGHRLGSVLAATFVLTLSRRDAAALVPSRAAAPLWRGIGLALVALAAWWLNLPEDAVRAEALARDGKFSAAVVRANRAIVRAPLDWHPHFTRAVALGCQGKIIESLADFRRARLLEPHYAMLPYDEGRFWLRIQPELALAAWGEALRRVRAPDDAGLFATMIRSAPNDAAFRARLLQIASGRDRLQMDWFFQVPPAEAKGRIEELAPVAARGDAALRAAFEKRAGEIGAASAPRP